MTTVPTPRLVRVLVWLGLPAVGAALLLFAVRVLDWLPFSGPFGVLRHLSPGLGTIVALAAGAVLGLVLAALVDRESLTVRLTGTEVLLTRPGTTRAVPRGEVAVAFRDRDQLVLLGRTGRELAREPCHLAAPRLRAAFAQHGVPWVDDDPYRAAYRRWVPGLPDVPAAADAIFAARQQAVEAGDDGDRRELREELGRLGIVVRDRGRRQYWRKADG